MVKVKTREQINEDMPKRNNAIRVQHRIHARHCWGCDGVIARGNKRQKSHIGLCKPCATNPDIRPKCLGTTVKGEPCRAMATKQLDYSYPQPVGYCLRHDPQGDWDYFKDRISKGPNGKDRRRNV